jgi:hypothetical protein
MLAAEKTTTRVTGTYPFGSPLRAVVQAERSPKPVFVLGVYASAVHARWISPDGKTLIRALAVASEPCIFWDGSDAEGLVSQISVPDGAGRLVAAAQQSNGPSGRSLDDNFLGPLGIGRSSAWLCDLVPHTCMNPSQAKALKREYEPNAEALCLPKVDLPSVPKQYADDQRRRQILAEVEEAKPDVIVLLGDKPIRHFLKIFDARWRKLSDFGVTADTYGRLHEAKINGRNYKVLPVGHPRQVSGLGSHSKRWRDLHANWRTNVAGELLKTIV